MRNLSTIMVVLVMLAMCATSFGNYFLIYNVSASVKGADDNTGLAATIPLKGYLVLNLSGPVTVEDANLVLYGNDSNTPKKQKAYIELSYTEMADGHFVEMTHIGDFIFLEIAEYADPGPFYFDVYVMGKWKEKDISGTLTPVASSMKGALVVWSGYLLGPSPDQDISGTSNISLTLNNTYTKYVNGTDPTWTQDQILNGQMIDGALRGIKPDLEKKGFINGAF